MQVYQKATEAANYLHTLLPDTLKVPKVAIICGSGLGGLANTLDSSPQIHINYADIPHFPQSTGNEDTSRIEAEEIKTVQYRAMLASWLLESWEHLDIKSS